MLRLSLKNHTPGMCSLVLSLSLIIPGLVSSQQSVGVVTALKGQAQLTREGDQNVLRFRDNLVLRDTIDTRARALARILFGGKSTVTVRELSRLKVHEELLPSGASRSIHDLSSGSILVNVLHRLLSPGDEIHIRTPNAIAGIRGTTIFAQYNVALAQSIFILIEGSAFVIPAGRPPISLTPLARITIEGSAATGIQVRQDTVTQADADKIVEESDPGLALKKEGRQNITEGEAEQAVKDVEATEPKNDQATIISPTRESSVLTAPITPVISTDLPKQDHYSPKQEYYSPK